MNDHGAEIARLSDAEREVLDAILVALWQCKTERSYEYCRAQVEGAVGHLIDTHVAQAIRDLAAEVEWKYRSMSFSCGKAESSTRLHPAGAWLRERAERFIPRGGSNG